jgi:hypothetical protein
MDLLNPPKNYIDFRCYVHGLSGPELSDAQRRFYQKHSESKGEIIRFSNWLKNQQENWLLPVEKIEVREHDGKKHGRVIEAMIYDIEYWIEDNQIKQRKIYMARQGIFGSLMEVNRVCNEMAGSPKSYKSQEEIPF